MPPAKRQMDLGSFFAAAPAIKKPRASSPIASSSSASPFSRATYTASLSKVAKTGFKQSEAELLALECETMEENWLEMLQAEIRKPYFLSLKSFLWAEGVQGAEVQSSKVYPAARDIYAWSKTPLPGVRVVIIGQDPYHGPGQAHGLCFSVRPGCKVPPSLMNIYKELSAEYPDFKAPKSGSLLSWSDSGVLLLNTSLTVRAGDAGSHSKKGWETFTDKVVELVDKYGGSDGAGEKGKGVVFLAWGAWASKRVAKLSRTKHLILESAHPSPLSAHRGFLGNGHFKSANEWLLKTHGEKAQVDWKKL